MERIYLFGCFWRNANDGLYMCKRWEWEWIRLNMFKLNLKKLSNSIAEKRKISLPYKKNTCWLLFRNSKLFSKFKNSKFKKIQIQLLKKASHLLKAKLFLKICRIVNFDLKTLSMLLTHKAKSQTKMYFFVFVLFRKF